MRAFCRGKKIKIRSWAIRITLKIYGEILPKILDLSKLRRRRNLGLNVFHFPQKNWLIKVRLKKFAFTIELF